MWIGWAQDIWTHLTGSFRSIGPDSIPETMGRWMSSCTNIILSLPDAASEADSVKNDQELTNAELRTVTN